METVKIKCIPTTLFDIDENGTQVQVAAMVPETPIDQSRLLSMVCDGTFYTVVYKTL